MARPRTIDRAQILDAARQVFLEHGFSASTAAIAREAGVSEGSIFKRFATKEDLFVAAMGLEDLELDLEGMAAGQDARAALERIGQRLIRFFREMMPRMMRLWAHCPPGQTPFTHMHRADEDAPPRRVLRHVQRHLEAEHAAGGLAIEDAEVTARMLIASMQSFVFFELVGGQPTASRTPEDYVQEVVDTLWRGIAPRSAEEVSR